MINAPKWLLFVCQYVTEAFNNRETLGRVVQSLIMLAQDKGEF